MDIETCQMQLRQHAELIRELVSGISQEQSVKRPTPNDWSVLEVVNHLYDEEREDFRVRLDILLHAPGKQWPPIDPAGWVAARKYNDRALSSSLQNFLDERQKSLAWLTGLDNPDFERYDTHPVAGKFRAGDMLAAWVTHDVLHLRQLVELKYFLLDDLIRPYSSRYAGEW